MKKLVLPLVIASLVGACGVSTLPPQGQLLIHIDTNAPVPPGDGRALTRDDPAPLFDTLRVEAFPLGQDTPCPKCVRQFSVDTQQFQSDGVSFGVLLDPNVSGYRLRVTLFLESLVLPCTLLPTDVRDQTAECIADPQAQVPHRATVVQTTTTLPAIPEEGVEDVNLFLDVENVGQPRGSLDAPVDDVQPGPPGESQVGLWSGAQRTGCTSPQRADAGEVCVPSGAFWMGNVKWAKEGQGPISPRLVVLSPFYMKATEVTNGECLAVDECATSANTTAKLLGPTQCLILSNFSDRDERALDCTLPKARSAYCKAWGGDVATAAQIEFAARGTVGSVFPWGDDSPSCADAMWGREYRFGSDGACVDPTKHAIGPFTPGLGVRDRLELPTGTIVDLAGNLEELTRDRVPEGCRCEWPEELLRDPVCMASDPIANAALAGNWTYGIGSLAAQPGGCYPFNYVSAVAGFRCTRADQ